MVRLGAQRARAENPHEKAAAPRASACPACEAPGRYECPQCGGTGLVAVEEDACPDLCPLSRAVLDMYVFVERFGLEAWIKLNGTPTEMGGVLLEHLSAEIDRLAHEHRVREAERQRRACRKKP